MEFDARWHWPPVWPTLFCCVSLISSLLMLLTIFTKMIDLRTTSKLQSTGSAPGDGYPPVEPLLDFDWKTKEPIKIRPFKPKYNLTMSKSLLFFDKFTFTDILQGIQETTVNELIEMDKNYLDRIMLRRRLMADYTNTVLAAEDSVKSAVDEFYTWLVGTYLPTRYPRMFQIISPPGGNSSVLRNLVTGEDLSMCSSEAPKETLRALGGLVDDDFLFLVPSEDGDSFTLKGFVTCFPNGFNTSKKLNMKLRDIHKPVPNYKEKLEKSMDRYFAKLKPGRFIKRANVYVSLSMK